MSSEKKYTDTLRVRVDAELLELVKKEAERLNTDVSTYVRWCMRTGLYLEELNTFIKARSKEDEVNTLLKD
jgi:predicted HicB family RNase H-like nuclease